MNKIRRFEITNHDEYSIQVFVGRPNLNHHYRPTNASTKRINNYLERHRPEVHFETWEDPTGHQEQYIWIRLK